MGKKVFWAVLPLRTGTSSDISFNAFLDVAMSAGANNYGRISIPNMRVDQARYLVQKKFMEMSSDPDDTVVYLDEDHLHPSTVIESLVRDDKPVVASLSFRRGEPYFPCAFKRDQNGLLQPIRNYRKELTRVDAVGFPAVAIKRSVFTALETKGFTDFPHFSYTYPSFRFPSDDSFFCEVCERAGIEVWLDARIVCPHITFGIVNEDSWLQYRGEHSPSGGKVSVIIPARTEHLKACVDSLLATAPGCEVIVLGDLKLTSALPPQVKRLLLTTQWSVDRMFKTAMQLATGDILMLVSDDVEFHPGWLQMAMQGFGTFDDGNGVVEVSGGQFLISKGLVSGTVEEIVGKAKKDNRYAYAQASVVKPRVGE